MAKSNPNPWGHPVERAEFDDKALSVLNASSAPWMPATASGEWDAVMKVSDRCIPMRNREGSRWLRCDHVGATGCRGWPRRRCLNPVAGLSSARSKGERHYSRTGSGAIAERQRLRKERPARRHADAETKRRRMAAVSVHTPQPRSRRGPPRQRPRQKRYSSAHLHKG